MQSQQMWQKESVCDGRGKKGININENDQEKKESVQYPTQRAMYNKLA